jgi:acyl-CoA synthetase (AMP-forming)/AMP-acid ligase II
MQIGVGLSYWPWTALDEQVDLARLADDLGFSSVWVAETWGQDAVGMLGYIAAATTRIALGAAVIQMPARQPTAVAMAAATINELSRGRVRLGLGLSGPQVSEGWYGVPFTAPLGRTREYVEVIITGGENVHSSEVERVLDEHPGVIEAAVIGVPDEQWGESVKAFVTPSNPVTAKEIIEFCRERLAGYKCPKAIEFVTALPRNAAGKVLKRDLRDGGRGAERPST